MKNEFKKQDANGNKLYENIGMGLNLEHPDENMKRLINDRFEFLVNDLDKEDFKKYCKPFGGMAKVLRNYIKSCINE
jgi:hypothetical protein